MSNLDNIHLKNESDCFKGNFDKDPVEFYVNLDVYPKLLWKSNNSEELKVFWGESNAGEQKFKLWNFDLSKYQEFSFAGSLINGNISLKNSNLNFSVKNDIKFEMNQKDIRRKEDFIAKVEKAKNLINDGVKEKIVLSHEEIFSFTGTFPMAKAIDHIFDSSAYLVVFQRSADDLILSCTPESLFQLDDHTLKTEAIAGSRPNKQGAGKVLLTSQKDLDEHQFVVKDIEEKLSSIVSGYSFDLAPQILKIKNNIHLHTAFNGTIYSENEINLDHYVNVLHPTPALGTFNSENAAEIIKQIEGSSRGYYGAPMGIWNEREKKAEIVIGIRSLLIENNEISIRNGCGIVSASDPEEEWKEVCTKAKNFEWLKEFIKD